MEKRINNIAGYIFIIVSFITPLIFSAWPALSFTAAKIIPMFAAVLIGLFLWIIWSFHEGRFVFPKNFFFLAALMVPLSYLLSSFFSVHRATSFIGNGSQVGTASTILALFLFMYLVSLFMRSKDKILISYFVFVISYLLIAFFHILRLFFGADFLSFGIFTNMISNTIGRWADVGLFSGIVILLSLTSIEFLRLSKPIKILSYVSLVVSLFMLAVTNFSVFIWGPQPQSSFSLFTIIGFFALVFFVYFVSSSYEYSSKKIAKDKGEDDEESVPLKKGVPVRRIPVASFVVLIAAVVFTFGFIPLQNIISSYFKIDPIVEARLLWKPTADLSLSTLTSGPFYRPVVGYGPEQFSYKWLLEKPIEINNSEIWNSNFNSGVGFIPSTIVTVGLLGFLSWIAFLGLFLVLGARALFAKAKDPFSHYLTVSSFLVALYLWIIEIVYTPSLSLLIFTFFFTGLFLASLYREKIITEKEFIFERSKEKSFVSIMGLILVLIALLFWAYKIGERVVANSYVNKAEVILQTAQSMEDVNQAKVYLQNAISLDSQSAYLRALANISLLQANTLLQDDVTPVDQLRTQFQEVFQQSLNAARLAVVENPNDFENYITLGNVLESVVPLNIPDAYENAKISYEEAGKLNPKSPLVPYYLARLEVAHNSIDTAKQRIGDALALKPYYLDAIILLGRIQVSEGKNQDALVSFTVAQNIDPQNKDIAAIIESLRGKGNTAPAQEEDEDDSTSTSTDATDN